MSDELKEVIIKLIQKELGVKKESIGFKLPKKNGDSFLNDERFWITVMNENFNGDIETDDPELEQYVLVPISKIQDRLDIILGG